MISYQEDTNSPIKFVIRSYSSFSSMYFWHWGLPRWLIGEESVCQAGDTGFWSLAWEDPLEKEMATHFSILAWEIPWTGEPCGLQFVGLQRVRHDLVKQQLLMLKPDWPHDFLSLSFFNCLYSANLSFFLLFRFLKQPIILFGITLFP